MDTSSQRPSFQALPELSNGVRHSWDYFGRDDRLGTANLLNDDVVCRAASEEIRTGQRINITLPLTLPDPPFFSREPLRHTVMQLGRGAQDDVVDNLYLQASTQWDALRHLKDPEFGFYGGRGARQEDEGGADLGADAWAQTGIFGRGVLADVCRYFADVGRAYDPASAAVIEAEDLEATIRHQGCELREGDILMVRTGYVGRYVESSRKERQAMRAEVMSAGLSSDENMAAYLWNAGVSALAVDNPAVERLPPERSRPTLHTRLIPSLGFVLGEFFDFEALSSTCRSDGRYTSFFASVPLNLPGAVGSTGNAVAIR